MEVSNSVVSKKIKLDVGGYKYSTTLTTLQSHPNTMLGAMFSGKFPMNLDEDGFYFIDRDGKYFGPILNWLRDGNPPVVKNELEKMLLMEEAQFYQLDNFECFTLYEVKQKELDKQNLKFGCEISRDQWSDSQYIISACKTLPRTYCMVLVHQSTNDKIITNTQEFITATSTYNTIIREFDVCVSTQSSSWKFKIMSNAGAFFKTAGVSLQTVTSMDAFLLLHNGFELINLNGDIVYRRQGFDQTALSYQ